MPLRPHHFRTFHRRLYGGQMQKLILYKRNDDQQEGVVRTLTLFNCRRSDIMREGEPLLHDMVANHRTTWQIPREELDRVGVNWISNDDRFFDKQYGTGTWQPEPGVQIDVKLYAFWVTVNCFRVN